MMYETLLFDMNALGDIPDKDFTSRAVCAGSIPHGARGRDGGRPPQEAHTLGWTTGFHNIWVRSPPLTHFSQPPGSRVKPHRSQHKEIRVLVPNRNPQKLSPGGGLPERVPWRT